MSSPPDVPGPPISLGGRPADVSSGFVASITILPRKFSAPAALIASTATAPFTATTTSSPKRAAAEKFPQELPTPLFTGRAKPQSYSLQLGRGECAG